MKLSLQGQFMGSASALLPWMDEETVTDILINGLQSAFVEQAGKLVAIPCPFETRPALDAFIERLLVPLGRRVDATKPYVDGRLSDGSRFHLILPPLAPHGPLLSIRKSRSACHTELQSFGVSPMTEWVTEQLVMGRNVLIAGGTGSGKTTLLSRLLEKVPATERIVVVEETAEIVLRHPHAVFLEARPATPDGVGEVTLRALLRNALRMRPSRLVLGECRGEEAWDLLAAMNTGHAGSLCTIHANTPLDALRRLETLVMVGAGQVPWQAVREWVACAIHLVVFLKREGERRRIASITEVCGLEGDRYRYYPRFT